MHEAAGRRLAVPGHGPRERIGKGLVRVGTAQPGGLVMALGAMALPPK